MRPLVRIAILTSLISLLLPMAVAGQQPSPPPCSSDEAGQFDFWLGEWDLTWPGGQSGTPVGQTGRATNSLKKGLGTCVIEENFATADKSYIGRSWSVYSPSQKLWRQTWVDNTGAYLLFTGKFENGKMELRTKPVTRNGKVIISRMVFKNINKDSLDWDWQRSTDNGETWQDVWNIHYSRRK